MVVLLSAVTCAGTSAIAGAAVAHAAHGQNAGSLPPTPRAAHVAAAAAPQPVTSLAVASTSRTTVVLTWTPPQDATLAGLLIRRSLGSTPPASPADGTLVTRLSRGATTYTDADLTPGTRFSYAVFSYDSAAQFSAPATVGARTKAGTSTVLDACAGGDTLTVSQTWSPATASTYQVGCTLTLGPGVTLTIDPGTVVKLSGRIVVGSGSGLDAGVRGAAPVFFTSWRDSEVGGVVAQPPPQYNDYVADVVLQEHSTVSITNAVLRYGFVSIADGNFEASCGSSGSVHVTLTYSVIESPAEFGLCPSRGNGRYVVSHNVFEVTQMPSGTSGAAFSWSPSATDHMSMTANWFDFAGTSGPMHAIWAGLPLGIDLSGDAQSNTFTPGSGSTLVGVNGAIPAGSSWTVDLPAGVALVGSAPVGTFLGAVGTVTVGPGTTIGDASTGPMLLTVQSPGQLNIDGTAAAPVAFTTDSVIEVNGGGTTDITGAVFTGNKSTVTGGQGDIFEGSCSGGPETFTLRSSTLDSEVTLGQCSTTGSDAIDIEGNSFSRPADATFLALSTGASQPGQLVVVANAFAPNGAPAATQPQPAITVDGWPVQGIALGGASTNVFPGSGPDQVVQLSDSFVSASQTWEVSPAGGEVLALLASVYQHGPAVAISGTAVLDPGLVVKTEAGIGFDAVAGGTLDVAGSSAARVVFTSFTDSSIGGASNGNASSTGTPTGKGGDYTSSISASEDTNITIQYATFRDGLYAIAPSGVDPTFEGSLTVSHTTFNAEVAIGDLAQVEPTYAISMTNNTFNSNGSPSSNLVLGGNNVYDPSARQPTVFLYNVDPAGISLSGPSGNIFVGQGAGRVIALLGTVIPAGQSWSVDPSTGVVLAPVTDSDFLPNPGIDVAGTLTLLPGTAVKSAASAGIEVASTGILNASNGVVFDTITDNAVDGDSNGDGSLTTPSSGDYGDAILYDNVPSASISGDTFIDASIAIASPVGGNVALSNDTFTSNVTAISETANFGTNASIDGSSFSGNQVSIAVSSIWEPFGATPVSCQYLGRVKTSGNAYGSGALSTPLVTPNDYATIQAAMNPIPPTPVRAVPSGWTARIAAGNSDVLQGWGIEPCAQPQNSYTAVAIPMTFGT